MTGKTMEQALQDLAAEARDLGFVVAIWTPGEQALALAARAEKVARESAFYSQSDKWYRIQVCAETSFVVLDEDSGEEHDILYSELDPATEKFYRIAEHTDWPPIKRTS